MNPEPIEKALADWLPAHEVLAARGPRWDDESLVDADGIDLFWIQGRGDRLHALIFLDDERDRDAAVSALGECPANWRWIVCTPGDVDVARPLAAGAEAGVVVLDSALSVHAKAPPRPGIFIKQYPRLRKRWRSIARW